MLMVYNMYNLFLFIFSCASFTQILCYGSIFDKIRPKTGFFAELLKCSMCTGFHVGYIVFILFWLSNVQLFTNFYIGMFIFSLISSFFSYVLDKSFTDEGMIINLKNKQ